MKILKGKTAIITGATTGIGRGIAEVFAKQGANVLFTYSSSSDLAKEIEDNLSKENVIVKGYKSDASSFEDCQKLVNQITEEFDTVDILINNAGITRDNLLMRMQEEDFDKVIELDPEDSVSWKFRGESKYFLEAFSKVPSPPNTIIKSTILIKSS